MLASIPNSSAQEDTQIPSWIKNTASWWANDEISDREFLTGITWLINHNIISIAFMPCNILLEGSQEIVADGVVISSSKAVPDWVKNNAKWWSDDLIEDIDFMNGIEYLIELQIINIDNRKILGKVSIEDVQFSPVWNINKDDQVFVSSSLFEVYATYGDCIYDSTTKYLKWLRLAIGIDTSNLDKYREIAVWDDPQKSVVIYPNFTYSAYGEPGFYTYYRGECDDCTTTTLKPPTRLFTSSGNAHQVLNLLGYSTLSDDQVDRNPSILQQFDKVIMLHNEYVTRAMFDAITTHPNVIYLYPNALYAEIEVNYVDATMTLIRGHNYPEPEITNGFDWEFDNTHPYEYDTICSPMKFYKITNGWMTNCYPEEVFVRGGQLFDILKTIKDL